EQLIALFVFKFRRSAWSLFVVGSLLDRLLSKPIEPVTDGFLDDTVAFSESRECISLLSADRRENAFSQLLSIRLLSDFVEFFQRNIVQAAHYITFGLIRQVSSHTPMKALAVQLHSRAFRCKRWPR